MGFEGAQVNIREFKTQTQLSIIPLIGSVLRWWGNKTAFGVICVNVGRSLIQIHKQDYYYITVTVIQNCLGCVKAPPRPFYFIWHKAK